jgi:hypothetical protein
MKELIGQPEVESTWYMGGHVWAKLKNGPKKYKFSINDNVSSRVQRLYTTTVTPSLTIQEEPQATTGTQQPSSPEIPQPTENERVQAATSTQAPTTSLPINDDVPLPSSVLSEPLPSTDNFKPIPPARHRRPTATA